MTRKTILLPLTAVALLFAPVCRAQIYKSTHTEINFYSKTPAEDIEAKNTGATSLLNSNTNEIAFVAHVKWFKFQNGLMQEHFNEKYMESDKYPDATFKGKINEKIDFSKDGSYDVTTVGKLNIHGVEQDVTEKGTLTVKDGKVHIKSIMKVKIADYKITPPTLVTAKIAEVIDVTTEADYEPYKK